MLIAFDLDDTLYKERDFVASGCEAVARRVAETGKLSVEEARAILCDSAITAEGFDRLAEATDGILGLKDILDTYRYHSPEISLPKESEDVLEELLRRGHTLALITDGRTATQRGKINSLGLNRFFDQRNIIISGETGADKHQPIPFSLAEERNPDEEERVYVGDNPAKDFHHPNLMGWRTIRLNDVDGVNIHSQEIDVPPEYQAGETIDSISELLDIL